MQKYSNKFKKLSFLAIGSILMTAFSMSPAVAEYPEKPIKLIVGFSAGGGTDSIARSIGSFIHEEVGMPGVVINKTGAGSMIAVKFFETQKPDGYTLFVQSGASASWHCWHLEASALCSHEKSIQEGPGCHRRSQEEPGETALGSFWQGQHQQYCRFTFHSGQ